MLHVLWLPSPCSAPAPLPLPLHRRGSNSCAPRVRRAAGRGAPPLVARPPTLALHKAAPGAPECMHVPLAPARVPTAACTSPRLPCSEVRREERAAERAQSDAKREEKAIAGFQEAIQAKQAVSPPARSALLAAGGGARSAGRAGPRRDAMLAGLGLAAPALHS